MDALDRTIRVTKRSIDIVDNTSTESLLLREGFDCDFVRIGMSLVENGRPIRVYLDPSSALFMGSERNHLVIEFSESFRKTYELSKEDMKSFVQDLYLTHYKKGDVITQKSWDE